MEIISENYTKILGDWLRTLPPSHLSTMIPVPLYLKYRQIIGYMAYIQLTYSK